MMRVIWKELIKVKKKYSCGLSINHWLTVIPMNLFIPLSNNYFDASTLKPSLIVCTHPVLHQNNLPACPHSRYVMFTLLVITVLSPTSGPGWSLLTTGSGSSCRTFAQLTQDCEAEHWAHSAIYILKYEAHSQGWNHKRILFEETPQYVN